MPTAIRQEYLSLAPEAAVALLAGRAKALAAGQAGRFVLGIAGGPGVGKSTIAAEIAAALDREAPGFAAYVPMDGFHMKQSKLEALGLVADKGMPHTFEGALFAQFLARLKAAAGPVSGPGYSRRIEDVVEDAFVVPAAARLLVVEGNYLLLPEAPWDAIRPLLDVAAFIHVDRDRVWHRLMQRHAEAGLFTEERNRAHIARVDLPNYDLIETHAGRADLVIDIDSAK